LHIRNSVIYRRVLHFIAKRSHRVLCGEEGAIETLKTARSLRREYAQKFQRQDVRTRSGRTVKDNVGDVVERMIAADPTDEQVINYFFNASKLGGRQAGTQLVKHIKTELGATSPEFQALREAAFMKLTGVRRDAPVPSGQVMSTQLSEALRDAPTLMKHLYSDEEIVMLKRLAGAIKRAQPAIENPSRTSYAAASQLRQFFSKAMEFIGFAQGGIAGAMGARAASEGVEHLGDRAAARTARQVTREPSRPLRRLAGAGPALGAPAAAAASEEDETLQRGSDLARELINF